MIYTHVLKVAAGGAASPLDGLVGGVPLAVAPVLVDGPGDWPLLT